jgi:hypothetical protein
MTVEVQQKARIADDLALMLARKRKLDIESQVSNNMASYDRWIIDALELQLRIELERNR